MTRPTIMRHALDEAPEEGLRRTRQRIDELDRGIIDLLSSRAALSRQAAAAKADLGYAIRDTSREAAFLKERRRWADEVGLDAGAVAAIFLAILRFSRSVQTRDRRRPSAAAAPDRAARGRAVRAGSAPARAVRARAGRRQKRLVVR